MEPQDFITDIYLSTEEKKACVDIMRETGNVPTPATDGEIKAIESWLNFSKKETPNLMTHVYKDCCFLKMNNKWSLANRNNDFMYANLLKEKQNG